MRIRTFGLAKGTAKASCHRVRIPQWLRAIRKRLRLSQNEFAARYGIPIGTLRDWEQGRVRPDAATRAFLVTIDSDPEAVARALRRGG